MKKILFPLLLGLRTAAADPWFDGSPEYVDEQSRALATAMLTAHGGMAPMSAAKSLQFDFFTKVIGGPMPFYSLESVDLENGNAYIEWPFWNSRVAWNDGELWSHQWPMPMPAGFFIRLTTSFITLPWQINADSANVGPVSSGQVPDDETVYDVLRVTFDHRSPTIPGTFYDIYVDRDTRLMKAIRFDINHPGMVANPNQPIGPNVHVFGEYRQFDGLILPTFYKTYGTGAANGAPSNAYHFVWNVTLDQSFDNAGLVAPADSVIDTLSMQWWSPEIRQSKGVR